MKIKDTNKIIVLVDAYSSGSELAAEFNKKGYKCAHVQSRSDLPLRLTNSYKKDDFFISLLYAENNTVNQLKKYTIVSVIAGCESGTELADSLAETLGVLGNDKETSNLRRNKYLMQESLRNNGLSHIQTHRITNTNGAINHAAELFNKYQKVVLKPVDSSGTDSVFVCKNMEEVRDHSNNLLNKSNQLNLQNETVILQPFIEGEEYVVDTVSYNGHHKICAIWKMGKGSYNGSESICEFTELTSLDNHHHSKLRDYVFSCLDSLGIKFGAAHSELFLTTDGWKLIETGARLHGAGFPTLSSLALKRTQIDELVLSICSTDIFLESIFERYVPVKYLKIKELISFSSGVLKSINNIDTICELPSYKKSIMPKIGQKLKPTTDVPSSPGWIALSHSSYDQINYDYQRIVELERQGMFDFYE